VRSGKVLTAAGVSAGIDLALTLVGDLYGTDVAQAVQLGIEYDPQPPFDAGAPSKAPAEILDLVTAIMRDAEVRLLDEA
jgi:transcriptional regulator GlxA family with amidase domain